MAKVHGKDGDVSLGGTLMKVKEWSATVTRDEHDTTNKGSSGNQEMILGIKRCEGSFKAEWDTAAGGANTPPYAKCEPQENVAVVLYIGSSVATTGQSRLSFTAVIPSLEITSAHDGVIEYTCNFKSSGAITHTPNT